MEMQMPYTLDDMKRARERIAREVPGAIFSTGDFDLRLGVAAPNRKRAYLLFAPAEPERGHPDEFIADLDQTIAALKQD
jgi:hypothetical protein